MNEKIMECFTNPVQCKLFIEIQRKGQATAKQLAKVHDIPHATLYRHLKKMTVNGILKVVEENQIRGTVEKVYAVTDDLLVDTNKMMEENNGQAYLMLFTQFIMGLTEEFQEYASRSDINLSQDVTGFTVAPVYASADELTTALTKIGEIIIPLVSNKKTPERCLHNIAIITTPPQKAIK